jgi:FkbM family methyltransferase
MSVRALDVLGWAARSARRTGLASVLDRVVGTADAVFARAGRPPIGVTVEGSNVRGYLRHRSYLAEAARPRTTYAQLYLERLTPETTIVDAGAHVGVYTVLAAPRCARVLAFEPDPYNVRALRANTDGLVNVTLIEAALDEKRGEATFYVTPSTIGSSLVERDRGKPRQVVTTTVDAELDGYEVRALLLKLNIEGAELRALEGARASLERAAEVTMFVEVNPALAEAAEIEGWLDANGFDVAHIDLATQRPVALPSPRRKGHLLATRISSRGAP